MDDTYKVVTTSERVDLEGVLRKFNEVYIIGAISLTDIEARATELLAELADGDFKVVSASPITYAKYILETKDIDETAEFYNVIVEYRDTNIEGEKTNKKQKDRYLVKARTLAGSEKAVESYFEGDGGYDFTVISASKVDYAGVLNLESRTAVESKEGGWVVKSTTKKKDGND